MHEPCLVADDYFYQHLVANVAKKKVHVVNDVGDAINSLICWPITFMDRSFKTKISSVAIPSGSFIPVVSQLFYSSYCTSSYTAIPLLKKIAVTNHACWLWFLVASSTKQPLQILGYCPRTMLILAPRACSRTESLQQQKPKNMNDTPQQESQHESQGSNENNKRKDLGFVNELDSKRRSNNKHKKATNKILQDW